MDSGQSRTQHGGMKRTDGAFRAMMIEAMARSGMNMAELARKSGVGYDLIAKLHKGTNTSTSAETAAKISKAWGINTENAQGFAEPDSVVRLMRAVEAADDGLASNANPDDFKIGTDGKLVQVIATVDREGVDRLIAILQAMKAGLKP